MEVWFQYELNCRFCTMDLYLCGPAYVGKAPRKFYIIGVEYPVSIRNYDYLKSISIGTRKLLIGT